jgi:hypothetical protein
MSSFRIVCVNREYTHSHITLVGTGTKVDEYSRAWTVKEVRAALEAGDRFYTISASTGKEADVRADTCHVPDASSRRSAQRQMPSRTTTSTT